MVAIPDADMLLTLLPISSEPGAIITVVAELCQSFQPFLQIAELFYQEDASKTLPVP